MQASLHALHTYDLLLSVTEKHPQNQYGLHLRDFIKCQSV